MTDSDQMDVDVQASSNIESLSASTSFHQLDLAKLDLATLNDSMERHCCLWDRAVIAGDDVSQWQKIIPYVLISLTKELAATDVKDSIIESPNLAYAEKILMGFSEDELKQWKAGVRSGVEKNDWTGLITHPKLRKVVQNVALRGVPIEQKNVVMCAWDLTYHGDAHEILLQAVDDLHALPEKHNYAKIVPVVQSSGTGKSKTVDKVATERILFPICVRGDIGKDSFAYPLTDTLVHRHLILAPSTTEESRCKEYLKTFLSSLFASAHLQAQRLFPGLEKVSYEHMATRFHAFFANMSDRNGFYGEVIKNVPKRSHKEVWAHFQNFKNYLKEGCSNWPPTICPILVSIDEVHVLYTPREVDKGSHSTLYSLLKSVLGTGVLEDFGVISLSTASHISSLAPSKEIAPSIHERERERILPAPFTELPFDVYVTVEPLAPGQATLTSVGSLDFTAKFGRPLFYASYLSRKALQETNIVNGIMHNVREKLSGRPWPPEAPADLDASSIAVLSARLLLDLFPASADAKQYEGELVRSHLRMLYSVDEKCQIIVTGSSLEPLIAEASAQIMHHHINDEKPYMDLWGLLGKYVDNGLAAQGAIGELIGRALSISAMDRAIDRLPEVRELKYQTPVTVTDYYKALLTDEAWEVLRRSVPANRARLSNKYADITFEVAFQDSFFHFSHYGKANDSAPMRDNYAWANWLRGTAVVCQLNQTLTDRMTPIYFSKLGSVSPKTISVNLDQDKTCQLENPAHVAIQSAEHLSIFSHGKKLPYIAAVHCYALTENQGIIVKTPSYNLRDTMHDQEAPCYQIDFRGLSAYGNITDPVRNTIRMMIDYSKNAVFNNHPRKYGLSSLRRMLPVLTGDPDSTGWFGGLVEADAWNAEAKDSTGGPSTTRQVKTKDSTAGPSTIGEVKTRKHPTADTSTAGIVKKKLKGKEIMKPQ